jgi:hypothetical protein
MTQLLSGFGRLVLKQLGTGAPQFRFTEPVAIKINNNSSEVVSYKMVDGLKVVAGAKQIQNENTATLSIEAGSWQALEIALGLESATTASLDLYELRFKEVPTSGAFEIIDPDIGTALGVQATVVENGTWGKSGALTLLATGSPAAEQFKVDAANNKIIFNAAQAGATIAYPLIKNYTALRTIGKEAAAARLNSMGFEGLVYTEDVSQSYKIVVPKMIRTKSTSLDLGEKSVLEIEYRMVVAPGQASDFFLVEMPINYNPG